MKERRREGVKISKNFSRSKLSINFSRYFKHFSTLRKSFPHHNSSQWVENLEICYTTDSTANGVKKTTLYSFRLSANDWNQSTKLVRQIKRILTGSSQLVKIDIVFGQQNNDWTTSLKVDANRLNVIQKRLATVIPYNYVMVSLEIQFARLCCCAFSSFLQIN